MNSSTNSEEASQDFVLVSADFYRKVRAQMIRKAKRGKNRKLTNEDRQQIELEVCEKRCFFPVQLRDLEQKMEISPEPEDNLASSAANVPNSEALFQEPVPHDE